MDETTYEAFDLQRHLPNFAKQCILLDITRKSIDSLGQQPSDWLITDIMYCDAIAKKVQL